MFKYLVRYSYSTCRADAGSQAWAEVETESRVNSLMDIKILKERILEQRGDGASVFIRYFKAVD